MKTSSLLTVTVVTLATASLLGGGLVRAFPTAPAAAGAGARPYQWQGYWDHAAARADGGALCPFRRNWSFGWDGPRTKWQRACATPG